MRASLRVARRRCRRAPSAHHLHLLHVVEPFQVDEQDIGVDAGVGGFAGDGEGDGLQAGADAVPLEVEGLVVLLALIVGAKSRPAPTGSSAPLV